VTGDPRSVCCGFWLMCAAWLGRGSGLTRGGEVVRQPPLLGGAARPSAPAVDGSGEVKQANTTAQGTDPTAMNPRPLARRAVHIEAPLSHAKCPTPASLHAGAQIVVLLQHAAPERLGTQTHARDAVRAQERRNQHAAGDSHGESRAQSSCCITAARVWRRKCLIIRLILTLSISHQHSLAAAHSAEPIRCCSSKPLCKHYAVHQRTRFAQTQSR
jgi:hypothetical protein